MTSYLQTAGWTLLHFFCQGAAIAPPDAATVLLRLTRRHGHHPIRDLHRPGDACGHRDHARLIRTAVDVRPADAAVSGNAIKIPPPPSGR